MNLDLRKRGKIFLWRLFISQRLAMQYPRINKSIALSSWMPKEDHSSRTAANIYCVVKIHFVGIFIKLFARGIGYLVHDLCWINKCILHAPISPPIALIRASILNDLFVCDSCCYCFVVFALAVVWCERESQIEICWRTRKKTHTHHISIISYDLFTFK